MEEKKKTLGRQVDSTMSFSLKDPQIEHLGFIKASLRLHSIREYLSALRVTADNDRAGLNYDVFLRNIFGVKTVVIDDAKLDFVRTTTGIFHITDKQSTIEKLSKSLPNVNFRRTYELSDGTNSVTMYRFNPTEFKLIKSLGARIAKGEGLVPLSFDEDVDPDSFKLKLSQFSKVGGADEFDLPDFLRKITDIELFSDGDERIHYVLADSSGGTYMLYVNISPKEHSENKLVFTGSCGNDFCSIYNVEVVG